ncbi:Leucine Rich repeat/Leucine Rich Repeat, putative [Trypanosoma equiperdum]|uniref:Leucine-rich repeat protein (LRRP) n=3 Tax=Trypanozoon TaxID=39700 RepID=Q581X0_TRYB2|nr:hypothetical protein, conserved [Trypanosoma brucei brucei TREU927]AAX79433.1 hypothetical protein, conserved [Trypanosoma brucei]AAZ12979.1 hypothetical protein, conserved [Trypanosoma brucei brucei TREU927]RHW70959.1 Leucine Rich repeat/Leucine Rich Repeat [Trypanosoma brucei equiperdum]SCU68303.1 Leucine Rich repeat/Leucine Rich Repeat, putative [Trypanosoma equiperdum]
MWEETYVRACANLGVQPRNEVLAAVGGTAQLCGNTFANFENRLTDEELAALCETCRQISLVAVVRLPYNNITCRGATALAKAMKEGFSTLQYLDLSYNSINEEGANAIAAAATNYEMLSTLLLNGNPIGGGSGPCLKTLLESENTQLVTLDLEQTDQGLKSLVHIARGLVHNTTLTTLNLGRPLMTNPMDVSYVVEHLSLALKENRTLRFLGLSHFNMADCDLALLLSTLRDSAVTTLSLKGNKLSQASGEPLAQLLAHRPDFLSLDVTANRLRDVGALAIAAVIANHPGLRELQIGFNTIGGVGISALAQSLAANASITTLKLWGNDLTDESVRDLYAIRGRFESMEVTDFSFYVVDGCPMVARE